MQLIFCMRRNIKVFHKWIQCLTNDMLGYLDFRYVHQTSNHEGNPLHKCQSETIANDNFYFKKKKLEARVQ